jgi:hypothetical protein
VATDPADVLVGSRLDVPAEITDAQEIADAQDCFRGLAVACDDLFLETAVGSVGETYGKTCAGRITEDEGDAFNCDDLLFAAFDVPGDVVDQATALACHDGDMVACDDLVRNNPDGGPDNDYGFVCGGRVLDTNVFCNTIFGDTTDL